PVIMKSYVAATGGYTGADRVVDPKNLQLDPDLRAPRTDEYSVGIDRALGRSVSVAAAYVHKDGAHFIGWTSTVGKYDPKELVLADGRSLTVFALDTQVTSIAARRFQLTNADEYSTTYNGLVLAADRRLSNGWQASGSYTFSKSYGMLPSSGTTAAGAPASTRAP